MERSWDPEEPDEEGTGRPLRRRARRPRETEAELSRDGDALPVGDGSEGDEVVAFEDRYEAEELAAIEAGPRGAKPVTTVSQWRRRSALGAVLTGMALGLQEVFDPEEERSIVIEVDAEGEPLDLPIQMYLDPDSPAGSLCIVHASDNRTPPVV